MYRHERTSSGPSAFGCFQCRNLWCLTRKLSQRVKESLDALTTRPQKPGPRLGTSFRPTPFMLSFIKSCVEAPRRKRKQREVPGHGSGNGGLSVSAGLPNEATANPKPPAGPSDNPKSDPDPPATSFAVATRNPSPPAGTSGTMVVDNRNIMNGAFAYASNFVVNNPTMIEGDNTNERWSMALLAEHVIVGAEFDSSDHRPSCHPETRVDISNNIQSWMRNLTRKYKILWLHGPAGVGKSAILQTIAETEAKSPASILGATLFFSRPNSRDDPQCVFITIAYRLAVTYHPYHQYIVRLLTLDPRLVEKSIEEQFKAIIVRPFVKEKVMDGLRDTVLILLDGLDECKGEDAQREIILLIGKFTLQYPTCPLIWLIASRPEPHIQDAFSDEELQLGYGEMQVHVDSDQARLDVEKYLRDSFTDIRKKHRRSIPSSLRQWPSESDFSAITTRSSGLFIFPSTIIRFIGDTDYADPISRLKTVLEVIESTSSSDGGHNPFETLDALYTWILTEIPRDVLQTTLRILAMHASRFDRGEFALNCNQLGVAQGRAYGALRRLHSVLKIPEPQNAFQQQLQAFHASFYDYLVSSSRSAAFYIIKPEIIQHHILRWIHVLLGSHSVEKSNVDVTRINLSWPPEKKEDRLRIQRRIFDWSLYYLMRVLGEFVNDSIQNEFSRLSAFFQDLDFGGVLDYVGIFDMLMYPESVFATKLEQWGVLKTIPLQSFNIDDIRLDLDRGIWRYTERGASLRVAWDTTNRGDTVPALERIFRYAAIVNSQGEASKDCDSRDFSDGPTWKVDLAKNLATWTEMAPSHPVTMLGKGRKSYACFQFHVPGELWVLGLPCVQSS